MFRAGGTLEHLKISNVPGKTLAPQGFWGKWNIGTFIFYIRVKERI
jgi:hypothetical protein